MALHIQKEAIAQMKLVPAVEDRSAVWQKELMYAVRLGNEFKGKTNITFETIQGPCEVETTVWSVTDDYLQLKGGTVIPLNCIVSMHY
ncbi:MAG: hypothetical protein WCG87_05200 [Bacteroidota bacterium]